MNPRLFISTLRARFGVFAAALALTVLAAATVSLMWPKSYRATASLVVDTPNEQSLSDALNVLVSARERLGYIQTQVDILTSTKVARKVVDDLQLAADPAIRAKFAAERNRGAIEDWLVASLLRDVEVDTSQSSVIALSFVAEKPRYAADVANGFARAYMDTMLALRVEPTRQAALWFDEQLKTLRADLETAQAKLTDYQRRHGIVSADERFDIDYTRLDDLSKQLLEAQQRTLALRIQDQQSRDVLAHASLDQLPEVQSNEQVRRLKLDLLAGESRLETLRAQYGVNYPEYQRQLAENASRRAALAAEMRRVVATTGSLLRESERREAELQTALAAQRSHLLELKEDRDELGVLAGNVETAQRAYDTAMQRYVVSQVESRASQTNVALLNAATIPAEPYRPKIGLNIALAVAVGTLLGIGLAVLLELSDRHVRTPTDLEHDANVPLIGVLSAWHPPPQLALPGTSGSDDAGRVG